MLTLAAALLAAAAGPAAAGDGDVAARALEYLATTVDETGVDVLVAVEIYGELAGDPRAVDVVRQARRRVAPAELERFGVLLGRAKPAFPPVSAADLPAPSRAPNLDAADEDPRAGSCPIEMLTCAASEACLDFATKEASGKALTHQALGLLFAHWGGCALPFDVDALRRRYAARLLVEARADPTPSDLHFERLALLGHLGFGAAIEPTWIEAVRRAQRPQGCFPAGATMPCHPHPTALALWVLGHEARVSGETSAPCVPAERRDGG